MTLKLKAKIYRYTGIYLAHKEENAYLDSIEFWESFQRMIAHPKHDMCLRNTAGLLIGIWQADHGFTRPYRPSTLKQIHKRLKKLKR